MPEEVRKGYQFPGNGVSDVTIWVVELNLCPLQEQQVLLTAKPPLQHLSSETADVLRWFCSVWLLETGSHVAHSGLRIDCVAEDDL